MRILAILGGVIVLAAGAAFGGALIGQQIELNAKQTRALNADIDRIVAERHEKNRAFTEVARSGLPALASATSANKVEAQVRKVAENPLPKPAIVQAKADEPVEDVTVRAETTGSSASASDRPPEAKSSQPTRSHRSSNRRRTARSFGPERVIPLAFASLPKFTAHTLLGLR